MTTILIILLIIALPFIGAFLYAIYLIITGKDKSPEVQAKLEEYKRRKAEKKKEKEEVDIKSVVININTDDEKTKNDDTKTIIININDDNIEVKKEK